MTRRLRRTATAGKSVSSHNGFLRCGTKHATEVKNKFMYREIGLIWMNLLNVF